MSVLDKLNGIEVFLVIIALIMGGTAVLGSFAAALGNRGQQRREGPERGSEDAREGQP